MKSYPNHRSKEWWSRKPINQYIILWMIGRSGRLEDEPSSVLKMFTVNISHAIPPKDLMLFTRKLYAGEKETIGPFRAYYVRSLNCYSFQISPKVLGYLCKKWGILKDRTGYKFLAKDWLVVCPMSPWTHPVIISFSLQSVIGIDIPRRW